ncbi:MAG TPA: DUF4252 domain-containing protein [Bacteroidales bacterium]|nr:DUF4252 domain-containing protein [Bacteroidales bacterium]
MKKLIIALLAFVFLAPMVQAQESVTQKLYDKYSGQEGFTTVHITKELFGMIAQMNFEGEDAAEMNKMKDAMSKLEFIRIVMFEDGEGNNKDLAAFRKDLSAFDLDGFKELMVVDEKDEKVRFVARQDGNIFKEFLVLIDSPDEAGFISIFGDMDMETISKVSQSMGIQQMGKFGKMHEHDDDKD